VNATEVLFGSLLAALLLFLAGYYAWRQKKILASLSTDDPTWNAEDRVYIRKQAVRRLWCSALMTVFAFMLIGSFFLEQAKPAQEPNQQEVTPEQKEYAWQVTIYWIVALFLLFAIVTLATLDIVAISRFAHRKVRQLDADRQAIIESHAARYRRDRNGD
jgi:hypothetical protein